MYGKDHKHLADGSIPVYGSGGLMRNVETALYNRKSVLIPRKGSLGNLFFLDQPFWTVDTLFYTIIDESQIVPEFLYYYLMTLDLAAMNVGSAVPSLTTALLNDIELRIPDMEMQERIAMTLRTFDRKIAVNAEINNHLEQMAQTIFKSWFVEFKPFGGKMPSDWQIGTFSDVIAETISGDWGKDAPTGNNTKKVYCIRGADIPDVNAGNKGKMPIRYILPKNYAIKQLVVGDIVVEISGGSPTQSTGRCALITQALLDRYERGMVCTNFCRAVKPNDGYAPFVYFYWKYLYSESVMFSYENGTTGIKNLDISSFLGTEPIIIPPVEVVYQFAHTVGTLIDTVFANGLENETLATTRNILLPRLISGELSIPDSGDSK